MNTPNPNFLREARYCVAMARQQHNRVKKYKARIAITLVSGVGAATDFLDVKDGRRLRAHYMVLARKWKANAYRRVS